jgi:branched-chain amino acid transport system ATP-binding protein
MSDVAALQVTDVRVRFGGLVAVDNVTLTAQPGELRAIIGPNGAGKTTLFNAIGGEVPLESGSVKIDGVELVGQPTHRLRRFGLARAYQVPQIFGALTVRQNLWISEAADGPHRWKAFSRARRLAHRSEFVEETCEAVGLSVAIDRPADELSHADQKVLDIAMALMLRPKVLLLDEPTQGVSPEEIQGIHRVVKAATQRATVLMIEHNMETLMALSDRVTVLVNGAVKAEGTPAEVMANDEVQRVYMGVAAPEQEGDR